MKYKFMAHDRVMYTHDKFYADFMNKRLTLWQRIVMFFSIDTFGMLVCLFLAIAIFSKRLDNSITIRDIIVWTGIVLMYLRFSKDNKK